MVREGGRGGERERREGWGGGKTREGEKKEMKVGRRWRGKRREYMNVFFLFMQVTRRTWKSMNCVCS